MMEDLISEAQKEIALRGVLAPTVTIADALAALHKRQYTGTIIMHFKDGKIACLDVPNPIKIRIE